MRQTDPATGGTLSLWMEDGDLPQTEPLVDDTEADVCIVGAGITGLTTAYLLAQEGKTVVILESGHIASGETERTTAHLSNAIDDRYARLETVRGASTARLAAEAHTAAIDRIEQIAQTEHIACDFRRIDGLLFPHDPSEDELLTQERDAAHRAGLTDVELLRESATPGGDTRLHLRFPQQARFHPLRYLTGLTLSILKSGGRISPATRVTEWERDGSHIVVRTKSGMRITAEHMVLATNMPLHALIGIYAKVAPYRTYAIALRAPKGSVPDALYWDTDNPYHYVRLQEHTDADDLLIVGGEDHKTGQADDMAQRYERLETWTRRHFPSAGDRVWRWSGQVQETSDGLGLIGRLPGGEDRVFCATGDSGMGMTHGTIAGMLLTDLIAGREHAWEEVFDPGRLPLKGTPTLLQENVNVAKELAGGYLEAGEVSSPEAVGTGEGALLRSGAKKIALYRDDHGELFSFSAVCPHKGCIVQWNPGERSWDCPCHGSRFSAKGNVLTAPAGQDLPPHPVEESPA